MCHMLNSRHNFTFFFYYISYKQTTPSVIFPWLEFGRVIFRAQALGAQELGALERLTATFSAFGLGGAGGGLLEHPLRVLPVFQDSQHGCVGGLAGELGGVEQLVVNDEAGTRAVGGLIGRKLVAGHGVSLREPEGNVTFRQIRQAWQGQVVPYVERVI